MNTGYEDVAARIHAARIVPVLRTTEADSASRLLERLLAAGVGAVEMTTTTRGWVEVVRHAVGDPRAMVVGAGTVTTATLAEAALASGAEFLVSPYPAAEVRAVAAEAGVPFIEGGFTPAEIADAAGRGLAKLFPAHVGGIRYLRSVLAVLPGARIIPTGGIAVQDVRQRLDAGAFAVGVDSDLFAGDIAERLATIGPAPGAPA